MELFSIVITAAEAIRNRLFAQAEANLLARVNNHKRDYSDFWANADATPDEILAAMGTQALRWLQFAAQSVEDITALAAISGKSLEEVLPAEWREPRRAFIPHEDGTVTLAQAA